MKLSQYIYSFLLSMTLSIASYAQSSTDYKLVFDKTDVGSGAIKVRCDFTIDFNGRDSLILDFGGNLEEESAAELSIKSNKVRYDFCPDKKTICFHKNKMDRMKVRMEYVFMNLTSVLMYGNSGAEIWESFYTSSGEFYYPMDRGNIYSGRVRFIVPDSLEVVSSASKNPERWHKIKQMVPLNFAFLDKTLYEKVSIDSERSFDVYQVIGEQADTTRISELKDLTTKAMKWFETKFGESFINPNLGTYTYPTFVFHEGNSSFNRYNMGFISASQEKFSSYPDIYPIIHEIGHRWFGEYTMFIESGEKGYAFIIETLNEFMTLMCIRDIIGVEEYECIIRKYREEWEKIKGTSLDIHPIEITEINNIPVTYRKGPVMLDEVARKVGYEKFVSSIVDYYKTHKGQREVEFHDIFLNIEGESE